MVQQGRLSGRPFDDGDLGSSKGGLFEGCSEKGCTGKVEETCGCQRRFCQKHIKEHRLKTHRKKT